MPTSTAPESQVTQAFKQDLASGHARKSVSGSSGWTSSRDMPMIRKSLFNYLYRYDRIIVSDMLFK
jgi:hypothetical protein